jgi:hypothetical protein
MHCTGFATFVDPMGYRDRQHVEGEIPFVFEFPHERVPAPTPVPVPTPRRPPTATDLRRLHVVRTHQKRGQ